MDRKEQILKIKTYIKQLAAQQKTDKAARKGCPQEKQSGLWCTVYARSNKITVALNLYLELRGKEYRHAMKDQYWAGALRERLVKELKIDLAFLKA